MYGYITEPESAVSAALGGIAKKRKLDLSGFNIIPAKTVKIEESSYDPNSKEDPRPTAE